MIEFVSKTIKVRGCLFLLKSGTKRPKTRVFILMFYTFEPPHDKTNKMACAPSEDSDQPGHPPSLIRVFQCTQWVAKDPSFRHADSED